MSEQRPAATPTIQVDNDTVRVTEWRFPPGGATGWHRHGFDYVVVPMTTGPLQAEMPGGEIVDFELVQGQSYAREAGVEHDVINPNAFEFVFVEVEMKDRAG